MAKTQVKKKVAKKIAKKKVTTNQQEGAHAKHGPSTLRAKELCCHFTDKPDRDTSAADEGTKAHDYLEHNVLKDNMAQLKKFTDDMRGHIGMIREFLDDEFFENDHSKWTIFPEKKVNLKPAEIDGCDKGTVDLFAISKEDPTYARAADYKFGFIEVDDPEDNLQTWTSVSYTHLTLPTTPYV